MSYKGKWVQLVGDTDVIYKVIDDIEYHVLLNDGDFGTIWVRKECIEKVIPSIITSLLEEIL